VLLAACCAVLGRTPMSDDITLPQALITRKHADFVIVAVSVLPSGAGRGSSRGTAAEAGPGKARQSASAVTLAILFNIISTLRRTSRAFRTFPHLEGYGAATVTRIGTLRSCRSRRTFRNNQRGRRDLGNHILDQSALRPARPDPRHSCDPTNGARESRSCDRHRSNRFQRSTRW
jgi:hypothetical protein